jgi:hypothetical protein
MRLLVGVMTVLKSRERRSSLSAFIIQFISGNNADSL